MVSSGATPFKSARAGIAVARSRIVPATIPATTPNHSPAPKALNPVSGIATSTTRTSVNGHHAIVRAAFHNVRNRQAREVLAGLAVALQTGVEGGHFQIGELGGVGRDVA